MWRGWRTKLWEGNQNHWTSSNHVIFTERTEDAFLFEQMFSFTVILLISFLSENFLPGLKWLYELFFSPPTLRATYSNASAEIVQKWVMPDLCSICVHVRKSVCVYVYVCERSSCLLHHASTFSEDALVSLTVLRDFFFSKLHFDLSVNNRITVWHVGVQLSHIHAWNLFI